MVNKGAANVRLCEALPLTVLAPPWTSIRKLPPLETEIEVKDREWEMERHCKNLFEDGVL